MMTIPFSAYLGVGKSISQQTVEEEEIVEDAGSGSLTLHLVLSLQKQNASF